MAISRRLFLESASFAALSGVAGCRLAGGWGCRMSGEPDVRFGVVSDVHLRTPGDEDTLVKAFQYFRDQGVDAVLLAGDIADFLATAVRTDDMSKNSSSTATTTSGPPYT